MRAPDGQRHRTDVSDVRRPTGILAMWSASPGDDRVSGGNLPGPRPGLLAEDNRQHVALGSSLPTLTAYGGHAARMPTGCAPDSRPVYRPRQQVSITCRGHTAIWRRGHGAVQGIVARK